MIDYYAPNIDLTLLGCGFLVNYHLGAIYLLSQVWPHKPFSRICGASCGGIVAACIVSGFPIERTVAKFEDCMDKLRAFIRNPSHGLVGMHEIIEQLLQSTLPRNAHEICKNRLGISLTKLWSLENVFACQFESRQDLIDAVLAGCFIPFWSGRLEIPKYRGQKCVDGGFSDNLPKFSSHLNEQQHSNSRRQVDSPDSLLRQVHVCAIASDVEICPSERIGFSMKSFGTVYYFNWSTFFRGIGTLFPYDAKFYRQYFKEGHRDMKNYILDNDMVKCQQCSWIKLSPPIRQSCLYCLRLMEKIESLKVPQNLM